MGHTADPADQLAVPEDGNDGGDIAGMHVADGAVVVGEHVPRVDAWVHFPGVFYHVFDSGAHGADVNDDAGRGQYAVTGRVVQREAQFAFLLDDGRGRNFLCRLAGMHQAATNSGEQLFIGNRVGFLELQLLQAVVKAGAFGSLQHLVAMLFEGLAVAQQIGQTKFFSRHHVHD